MRPPGNTHAPPWNASCDERRASSTSRPSRPSRMSTTVAAGAAAAPLGLASRRSPAMRSCSSLMRLRPPALHRPGDGIDTVRAGGSAPRSQRLDGELAALVARAQDLLVELADAG